MGYKNKEEILKKIAEFHKLYKKKLVNKNFLLIYKNFEEMKKVSISFSKENFFHLTGLGQSKSFITPLNFYKKLERRQLEITDFEVKNFTLKKLSVSTEMVKIFSEKSKIAVYDTKNKYQKNLSIDNGMALSIPESNAVLGIRYIKDDKSVPVSLLQQKLENISQKDTITDIVCMLEKTIKEEEYNKIVYNTIDMKVLLEKNKELEKLLTKDLLKEIYPEKENSEEKKEPEKNQEKAKKKSRWNKSSVEKENEKDEKMSSWKAKINRDREAEREENGLEYSLEVKTVIEEVTVKTTEE